jgi:hypothetical protein
MSRTVEGSVMKAMIRISAPQSEQRAAPARTGLGALIERAFGIEFA